VGVALDMTRSGFVWRDNVIKTEGHSIEIYNGCSSFHNISLAALCWIALTRLKRPAFIKSDFLFGAAACLAMIALNATRLYTMSLSFEKYEYWHDGFGSEIFAAASTLIIATICVWGASVDDARRE
jgi:exosortase/archaeosortase family protein